MFIKESDISESRKLGQYLDLKCRTIIEVSTGNISQLVDGTENGTKDQ